LEVASKKQEGRGCLGPNVGVWSNQQGNRGGKEKRLGYGKREEKRPSSNVAVKPRGEKGETMCSGRGDAGGPCVRRELGEGGTSIDNGM